MLQFLIFRLVEAKEEGFFLLRRVYRLVCLFEHLQPLHLVVEVAAVEMHVQYSFIEILQFIDGEHLGQPRDFVLTAQNV